MAEAIQARPASATGRGRRSTMARREALVAYTLLFPWILGFVLFVAGPIIA
jgi:multiple sugar transport system permease protein